MHECWIFVYDCSSSVLRRCLVELKQYSPQVNECGIRDGVKMMVGQQKTVPDCCRSNAVQDYPWNANNKFFVLFTSQMNFSSSSTFLWGHSFIHSFVFWPK